MGPNRRGGSHPPLPLSATIPHARISLSTRVTLLPLYTPPHPLPSIPPSQPNPNPTTTNTTTMSTDTARSSTESNVSGLDYEETELKLALPGASRPPAADVDRKRGFSETVAELSLGASRTDSPNGDCSDDSQTSVAGKPPAAK